MCGAIFLHLLVKIYFVSIINCYLYIYSSSFIFSCLHFCDISQNGSNRNIFFFMYWKYLSQVGYGYLPRLDSLCLIVGNWILCFKLLPQWWLMHCCFLGIILLNCCWCLFLWFLETFLLVKPWYGREMNAVDGLCCSECTNTDLFPFINPHMACQYLVGDIFPSLSLIV